MRALRVLSLVSWVHHLLLRLVLLGVVLLWHLHLIGIRLWLVDHLRICSLEVGGVAIDLRCIWLVSWPSIVHLLLSAGYLRLRLVRHPLLASFLLSFLREGRGWSVCIRVVFILSIIVLESSPCLLHQSVQSLLNVVVWLLWLVRSLSHVRRVRSLYLSQLYQLVMIWRSLPKNFLGGIALHELGLVNLALILSNPTYALAYCLEVFGIFHWSLF